MAHQQQHDEAMPSLEAPDAAGVYRIWPGNGVPPGSEGWDHQERTAPVPWSARPRSYTRNVVLPTVTLFRPRPGRANGTTMIIAPGGAFHFLMIEHEGYDMARWLCGLGVTALVLKYRLMRTPDDDEAMEAFRNDLQKRLGKPDHTETAPPNRDFMRDVRLMGEEDGRQAIRFARDHAADWELDPNRIGIVGYSAGGGPALGAAMQHDARSRPDFVVGVYPAYRADLSPPQSPPPLFLTIADDDAQVAPLSATRLYEAWRKAGGAAELHVFGDGAHGFGMNQDGYLADTWTKLLENWMRARGLLGLQRAPLSQAP